MAFIANDFLSGAWIVFPAYMLYVSGKEILQGLELATGESRKDQ